PSSLTLASTFYADPVGSRLDLILDYQTGDLARAQVETIADAYVLALRAIAEDLDGRYELNPLMADVRRHDVVTAFNETAVAYASDRCAHDLIAECAARSPGAV